MWEPEGMTEVYSQQKIILEVGDHFFLSFQKFNHMVYQKYVNSQHKNTNSGFKIFCIQK